MKKRQYQWAAIVLVMAMFFIGCTKQEKGSVVNQLFDEKQYNWGNISGETITVWGDGNDLNRPYMLRAFERYLELTGNTLQIRELSKKEQDELLPEVFASESAERPDILLSYGGTNVENLNPDKNFYDFTDAQWIDDLSDTAINQAVFNGKVIGLPHGEASVSGTLYNKEVFDKYKIEIPKTQEEFLKVCEILLNNGITPMYLPYAEITMLLYQFPMDSILKDQTILDGLNDGTLSYSDIPEMKKIVEWYKTMSDRGYFGKDYSKNDWNGMDAAMKNGEYGMMLCWDTWLYTNYSGDPTKIGLMPAFMGTPENGCFEGANIILCIANKKSTRLDASLDLITFLADPYNYNINYAGVYTAPVFNNQSGSITTPQYMEQERLIDKLFNDSVAWSRLRGFAQIDASYIQKYMQGEYTVEQCLDLMDSSRVKRVGISSTEKTK